MGFWIVFCQFILRVSRNGVSPSSSSSQTYDNSDISVMSLAELQQREPELKQAQPGPGTAAFQGVSGASAEADLDIRTPKEQVRALEEENAPLRSDLAEASRPTKMCRFSSPRAASVHGFHTHATRSIMPRQDSDSKDNGLDSGKSITPIDGFFTVEEKEAIDRCRIQINQNRGIYSDDCAVRVIEKAGGAPLEQVANLFPLYRNCRVKVGSQAEFFGRDLYKIHDPNRDPVVCDPTCSEEAILLEIQALRISRNAFKNMMFVEMGGKVVFGPWFNYAFHRLLQLPSRDIDRTGVASLGEYTAIKIIRSLFCFITKDLNEVVKPGILEELKTSYGVDWVRNVDIARKVINHCGGSAHFLHKDLTLVEAHVERLKRPSNSMKAHAHFSDSATEPPDTMVAATASGNDVAGWKFERESEFAERLIAGRKRSKETSIEYDKANVIFLEQIQTQLQNRFSSRMTGLDDEDRKKLCTILVDTFRSQVPTDWDQRKDVYNIALEVCRRLATMASLGGEIFGHENDPEGVLYWLLDFRHQANDILKRQSASGWTAEDENDLLLATKVDEVAQLIYQNFHVSKTDAKLSVISLSEWYRSKLSPLRFGFVESMQNVSPSDWTHKLLHGPIICSLISFSDNAIAALLFAQDPYSANFA
jgi:hypothetical protein